MSNINKLLTRVRDWNRAWACFDHGDAIDKPITSDELEVELGETFIITRCDDTMTFVDRLIIERDELSEKVGKLSTALVEETIPGTEVDVLFCQLATMESYLTILNFRIEKLN